MPNKFEAWKQGLTLEEFAETIAPINDPEICEFCPARHYCPMYPRINCEKNIKEWGESDAEQ